MRLLNSEMETVTVPESLLYYLLGYVVLEEKRKSGFQLAEHLDEETFRLFLGYTVYNIVLNPTLRLRIRL